MSLVRVINDEAHFQSELANASNKLVVADFTATWYKLNLLMIFMLFYSYGLT